MPNEGEMANRQRERRLWYELYGDGFASKENRKKLRREFREIFPYGHRSRVRNKLVELAAISLQGKQFDVPFEFCDRFHPRAWDIILKHGKHDTPRSWAVEKPWEWEYQPLSGSVS